MGPYILCTTHAYFCPFFLAILATFAILATVSFLAKSWKSRFLSLEGGGGQESRFSRPPPQVKIKAQLWVQGRPAYDLKVPRSTSKRHSERIELFCPFSFGLFSVF